MDTLRHDRTVDSRPNRTETGQENTTVRLSDKAPQGRKLARSHQDLWASRLKKRSYRDSEGNKVEVPEWQVRLFHQNKEGWFNLGTANKAAAAALARKIHEHLRAHGWDATLASFKAKGERENVLTVGAYCRAVQGSGILRIQTFLGYQNSLRTIVSNIFGVRGGKEKFDYKNGGAQRWQARVDAIRLDRITDDRVKAWQRKHVAAAGLSPVAIAAAKRTVNSYLRCARSLFSTRIVSALKDLDIPSKLPLVGLALLEAAGTKYVSKVNAGALIVAARNELRQTDVEAYKAFLLCLFAGMRKGEIDLLEWGMVDFRTGAILLEQTEWLHLKTADSTGMIPIDPELVVELQTLFAQSSSSFVITSDRPPRNDSSRAYYRCKPVFDRLTGWLRGKGVTANKPLHEMRKEIGAQIATQHGIYAASRFLRHSDIGTTARHYADQKDRVSVGLGRLLNTDIKTVKESA